jgi:hypothetical protein
VKGPFGKEKVIDPSTAHQIFGRAGRPQFDTEGFVYAVPHDDDVRLVKWKKQYDQIPEATKDPALMKKKKELLKKKPTRNSQRKYWGEGDFERLQQAPPARLYSKGTLPWRLLAYLLKVSPEVGKIRDVVRKRLLDQPRIEAGMKQLDRMLLVLHERGFVRLEPPPAAEETGDGSQGTGDKTVDVTPGAAPVPAVPTPGSPTHAHPTERLDQLLAFRAVHPLYGAFLVEHLGLASRDERVQIFESVLELPRPLLKFTRVPWDFTPGPLQTQRLDPELLQRGLIKPELPKEEGEDEDEFVHWEDRPPVLADKVRMLFDATHPDVLDVNTTAVWAAGEVLAFNSNFNAFITHKDLAKQEGIIFRHLLRMILLTEEFAALTPPGMDPRDWQAELKDIADRLTEACRQVDPTSTDKTIKNAHAVADVVAGEVPVPTAPPPTPEADPEDAFAAGLVD